MKKPLVIDRVPSSAGSQPFGTAWLPEITLGVDLEAGGYFEQEYFVSGVASVWTYDELQRPVESAPDVPFTTRVLIRRPIDAARASGVVQLEPLHPDLDSALTWGAIHPWIIREGHTWVGVTVYSHVAAQLHDLIDPVRYSAISIPSAGQEFDILGSVAQALRDGAFPDVSVSSLMLSGWSATGSFCRVFLQDGFHERWTTADSRSAVDGYVICISSGGAGLAGYPPLSPGCTPLQLDDARRTVSGHGATVFEVLSEMESETNGPSLREDSDEPSDRYRLYQVAGTAHIENRPNVLVNRTQFERAGGPAFGIETVEQRSDGRLDLVARAYFEAQLRWISDGTVASHGGRFAFDSGFIELPAGRFEPAGGIQARGRHLTRDADGNVEGGVRAPWIVAPTGRYSPHSTPVPDAPKPPEWMPFADPAMLALLMGSIVAFPVDELNRRYGSLENYLALFEQATEDLVSSGLLLDAEGAELVDDAPRRWAAVSVNPR